MIWPFSSTKAVVEQQPISSKPLTAWESFMKRPDVIKAKGVVKLGFGALVLLQPHYALMIGATLCVGGIAAATIQKVQGRSFGQMWKDVKDGTFLKELKNTMGMGAGAGLGLLAPYAGAVLAMGGVVSYMAGNPQGIEGIFKGGMMATAVGTVALPIVGAAFVAEGIANSLGYDVPLIGKAIDLSSRALKAVGKIVGVAEKNPNAPEVALNAGIKAVNKGVTEIEGVAKNVQPIISKTAEAVNKTVQKSELPKESKSWASKFSSYLGMDSKASFVEKHGSREANNNNQDLQK